MTRCRGEQLARVRTRKRLPSEAYQISDDRRLAHDLCIKTIRPMHGSAQLQP